MSTGFPLCNKYCYDSQYLNISNVNIKMYINNVHLYDIVK